MSEGDEEGDWILTDVAELDARGNPWRGYQPLELDGDPISSVEISGLPTPFSSAARDAFGRELWATAPEDGHRVHQTYYGSRWTRVLDGNDLYSSEHAGTASVTVVDGQGRTILSLVHDDRDDLSSVLMAQTEYDELDNILTLTRGEGTVTDGDYLSAAFVTGHTTSRSLLYDSLGRRTHNLDPDSGTSRYYYNRLGELTRFVDARGAVSRFLYDMAGRLIAEDHGFDVAGGASWAAPGPDGRSSDDDASVSDQAGLLAELWGGYQYGTPGEFEPSTGAEVLYGYDEAFPDTVGLCRAAPDPLVYSQANLLGALSWVRDQAGCSWTSYDERGRSTWSARQIDPDLRVFLTESSYDGPDGPDELDRVRAETYPDGTSLHYTFNNRGLLDRVEGDAPSAGSLFHNRVFVDAVGYDVFGAREWIRVGNTNDASENVVETVYARDHRRRLTFLASVLVHGDGSGEQTVIDNEYHFDEVGNITAVRDHRRIAARTWSPISVDYEYDYDALSQLIRARPTYASGPERPDDDEGTPDEDEERPGVQQWQHDYLGSMVSWTAVEDIAGEHFYDWSIGTIVNGQQLIEAGNTAGLSTRCGVMHPTTAAERTAGPAPHALYFAFQPTETAGEYEALEACYDEAGNMVALYRSTLSGCGTDPLDETTGNWSCTTEVDDWSLTMTWDPVGRLVRVVKSGAEQAELEHVYDASNGRVIRLDHETAAGTELATLYVSGGYEIRNAGIEPTDRTYLGGEETKFVFDGPNRLARIVEPNSRGLTWPYAPDEGYVVYTLTNHLGSAAVTVHAAPAIGEDPIIAAQVQLAYGAEDDAVDSPTHGGWRPDYEFTGKEQDPDVGLMYFGARFYSPGMGRWVSADPLAMHGLEADLNAYCYVRSNPLVLVDPTGLFDEPNFAGQHETTGGEGATARATLAALVDGITGAGSFVLGLLFGPGAYPPDPQATGWDIHSGQRVVNQSADAVDDALSVELADPREEAMSEVLETGMSVIGLVGAGIGIVGVVRGLRGSIRAADEVADAAQALSKSAREARIADDAAAVGDDAAEGASELVGRGGSSAPRGGGAYSGRLVRVNNPDPAADSLAQRLGGQSRVRFDSDPSGREFDAISSQFVAQTKPALRSVSQSFRRQARATFEAAIDTGRQPYFHFEGTPHRDVIRAINRYEQRYGVTAVIDTNPF